MRTTQKETSVEKLLRLAKDIREKAEKAAATERDALLKGAAQLEQAAHIDQWLTSRMVSWLRMMAVSLLRTRSCGLQGDRCKKKLFDARPELRGGNCAIMVRDKQKTEFYRAAICHRRNGNKDWDFSQYARVSFTAPQHRRRQK